MPPKKRKKERKFQVFFFKHNFNAREKKTTHFFSSSSGNEIQKTFLLMKFSIFCVKLKSFFSLRAMGKKKNLPKLCFLLSYTTKVLYFFCEKNINKTNWKHIFMTFLGDFFAHSNYTLDFFFLISHSISNLSFWPHESP